MRVTDILGSTVGFNAWTLLAEHRHINSNFQKILLLSLSLLVILKCTNLSYAIVT